MTQPHLVQTGDVASADVARILPYRSDGATYSGVITFTATAPVEIGFGHNLQIDNSTISQLEQYSAIFTRYTPSIAVNI